MIFIVLVTACFDPEFGTGTQCVLTNTRAVENGASTIHSQLVKFLMTCVSLRLFVTHRCVTRFCVLAVVLGESRWRSRYSDWIPGWTAEKSVCTKKKFCSFCPDGLWGPNNFVLVGTGGRTLGSISGGPLGRLLACIKWLG